ncbi:MAG: tRNA (N6-threonylcarbamoyladenosine(37)-N6)-methyltransferase TrmO, partial [Sedimenticola sp.]
MSFSFDPIGMVHSPYKEKFGIPRQPGLVCEARSRLELLAPYNLPQTVEGLAGYSHIWIQFVFHQAMEEGWRPRVRPPRLGGNQRVGLFASRSPFRPNPIGLSVVKLESIDTSNGVSLMLSGGDLLDGTPVLDIKPYVAYVDSIADATSGFAPTPPEKRFEVFFSPLSEEQIAARQDQQLRPFIRNLLEMDPRPAYSSGQEGRVYGIRLYDFDLRWRVVGDRLEVLELAEVISST